MALNQNTGTPPGGAPAGTNGAAAHRAARKAGLHYVADTGPGISRRRAGKNFVYRNAQGRALTGERALTRIRRLAVPPAYADVWICPDPAGHIQATGRDARGRKQYRYHADWRLYRDQSKFARLVDFARALPAIRRRVGRDLKQPGLGRDKVLASAVRLLETTLIRVGNERYKRDNNSFGLTTLRARHVAVNGHSLVFEFRGKGGKPWKVTLADPRLARVIKSCQDLPGQELFQYVGADDARGKVSSDDVNAYIRDAAAGRRNGGDHGGPHGAEGANGLDFSAKDFRTWAGTVLATDALKRHAGHAPQRAKRCIKAVTEAVASRLGNTVAICRKCYIHPEIFEAFLDGRLREGLTVKPRRGLAAGEAAVVALLERKRRG